MIRIKFIFSIEKICVGACSRIDFVHLRTRHYHIINPNIVDVLKKKN